jgi:hypothetical protein
VEDAAKSEPAAAWVLNSEVYAGDVVAAVVVVVAVAAVVVVADLWHVVP